jgi:peptidoglycan-N-acetylglucosamine deacetylase
MRRLHALTIDVEDWYHPELVRSCVSPDECVAQARATLQPVLELLERRRVKGTFFVVGEVAQSCPQIVRDIVGRGHELACHGFTHKPLWDLTPSSLAQELDDYALLMREIMGPGTRLVGFRAPTFSLDARTAWAVDVLLDHGYRYDSSVFPMKNYLYGVAGAPDVPYRISSTDVSRPDPAGRLLEFPMTVYRVAGLHIPVSGGAYLRALPMPILQACLRQVGGKRPIVVYVHPWELTQATPQVRMPFWSRLVTYYNRRGALSKLERLMQQFDFAPMGVVLSRLGLLV